MTDPVAFRKQEPVENQDNAQTPQGVYDRVQASLSSRLPDSALKKLEEMRAHPSVKPLSIKTISGGSAKRDGMDIQVRARRQAYESRSNEATSDRDTDEDNVLNLTAAQALPEQRSLWQVLITAAGGVFTALWLGYGFVFTFQAYGLAGLASMAPSQLGGILAGILAPVALFWMSAGYALRGSDIQRYSRALRTELQSLIFPTEARAQRVSSDIEKLCLQAAELAASSRAVIKAISRARQGLRAEIRDFVGISRKTEFHIDRLAETLHDRAQKLQGLTGEIEQRAAAISDKTQAGAAAWDNSTQHILARAAEMESALGRGADKILEAAHAVDEKTKEVESHFESSFDNLNRAVDKVAERLQGLSIEFDGHRLKLTDAASQISEETDRFAATIEEKVGGLEQVTARTIDSMLSSSQAIEQHREALEEGADKAARQAEEIAQTVTRSVDTLTDAALSMEGRVAGVEGRIQAQAEKMTVAAETAAKTAQAIEEAGSSSAP